MRESLFRGVSEETNEWVYGFGWFKTDYTEEYLKASGKIEQDAVLYTNSGPVLCYLDSMGEWTGLRDNKKTDEFPDGQMIFEGDIVESLTKINGYVCRGVVIFENGKFMVDVKKAAFSRNGFISDFDLKIREYEVIGNIYEDKHLLEGME